MGLKVDVPPEATFYIWLDLSGLAPPLNNGLVFFEELLKVNVPLGGLLKARRRPFAYRVCSSTSIRPSE